MDRCFALCLMIGAMLFTVTSGQDTTCPMGTYKIGDDCTGICGYCLDSNMTVTGCNQDGGECKPVENSKGVVEVFCKVGWKGAACNQPLCFQECGSGTCIGVNVCFCGRDINIVGPQCEDIRVRGVVGSIAAFATVTASIALCGLGSKLYKRRKEGASL